MFILFHLLTGLVIGYLLADRLEDRRVVLPCMLGALLPDLVDKPLAVIVFGGLLGPGRIFLHTFFAMAVLLVAGVVVYRRRARPGLLAAGLGLASHQALDWMWTQPREWFYPFLGRFRPIETEEWFLSALLAELGDPVEWVSAAALLVLLLPVLWPSGTAALVARYGRGLRWAALAAVPALAALGLVLLAIGAAGEPNLLTGWRDPWFSLVGGGVLLLTAYAAFRLFVRLGERPPRSVSNSYGA